MDIQNLVQQIIELAEKGPKGLQEADRQAVLQAAAKLKDGFENPMEKMANFVFSHQPYDVISLRLPIEMGLFDTATQKNGSITIEELSAPRNLDPVLVRRILRVLTGLKTFTQQDATTFTATPLARAFSTASPLSNPIIHIPRSHSAAFDLFYYFKENGYQSPGDAFANGPWQYRYGRGKTYFSSLAKNPLEQAAFNKSMAGMQMTRAEEQFEIFPVREKLVLAEEDKERILLVDVGGGIGHDVLAFHNAFPELPERLIFEDQEGVVASTAGNDLPARVQGVGDNFFELQPDTLKGAKVYYLRTILHDWPDKQARIILAHLKKVMAPDSLLLINENVLPQTNVPLLQARLDLHMMVNFAAKERTQEDWRGLLEGEGFEIRKVWQPVKPGQARFALVEVGVRV